jgi:SAM-dependent methyltransferase
VDGDSGRERLRRTFDAVAEEYQDARPEYPAALYEALISLTGVTAGVDELCEVGCASGKATLPLARRGFAIRCVELGGALAAEARRNLAGFGRVRVEHSDFESWGGGVGDADFESWGGGVGDADFESWGGGVGDAELESRTPGESPGTVRDDGVGGFGLVFAATAWHWIDPAVKYRKAWSLLRPGGHLAFWEAVHVIPEVGGDPFFAQIQDVYDEIGSGMPAGWVSPTPATLPDGRAEIEASGLFTDVTVRRFDWEIRYTADEYIRLLDTFSSNLSMAAWQRERLYGEIRGRLALRPDGLLRRHWGAVLNVARRS